MGTYTPIWKELKLHRKVSVAMHPRLHPNLVRQMSVEKDRDIGYKIQLGNDPAPKKAIMTKHIEGAMVTFYLSLYYLNGIPVIELGDL
jgi:hypothetical protein